MEQKPLKELLEEQSERLRREANEANALFRFMNSVASETNKDKTKK